jgi:type I restriction enzyme S subunit
MSVNRERDNLVRLGDHIEEIVLKVGENNYIEISGINLEHRFMPTVANMTGIDKSKYKLVPSECFACNLMHIGRDVRIPIAYNDSNKTIAVSPAYYIFKIKTNKKN